MRLNAATAMMQNSPSRLPTYPRVIVFVESFGPGPGEGVGRQDQLHRPMRPGDANEPKHASREAKPRDPGFWVDSLRSHTVRASAASFRRRPEPRCAVGAHFGYGQGPTGARSPSPLGSGLRRNDEVRRPRQGLGARPPQSRETSVNELSDIYNSRPLAIGAHRTTRMFEDELSKYRQGGAGVEPIAARFAKVCSITRCQTLRQGWTASNSRMIKYGDDQQQKNGPAIGFSSVAHPVQ